MEENKVEEIVIPPKRGRKPFTGIPRHNERQYSYEYYHMKRSTDVMCECGALVKSACMTRHKKRQIHIRRMKIIEP